MTHDNRLKQLFGEAAIHAVPDEPDLWPAIRATLAPQMIERSRRSVGWMTLAAAALIVAAFGMLMVYLTSDSSPTMPYAVLSLIDTATPEPTPTVPGSPTPGVAPWVTFEAANAPTKTWCWPDPDLCLSGPDALTPAPAVVFLPSDTPAPLPTAFPTAPASTSGPSEGMVITAADFQDGRLWITSSLSTALPYQTFTLQSVPEADLAHSDGWLIASVETDGFVPVLSVEPVSGGAETTGFQTADGAGLFRWDRLGQPAKGVNITVSGQMRSASASYALTIQALPASRDLDMQPLAVRFDESTPQIVRLPENMGALLHVNVSVEHALAAGETAPPEVALILPDGRTLTTFDPAQTSWLSIAFAPLPGDDFLWVYLQRKCLPTSSVRPCLPASEDDLALTISIQPVAASTPSSLESRQATATAVILEATVRAATPTAAAPLTSHQITATAIILQATARAATTTPRDAEPEVGVVLPEGSYTLYGVDVDSLAGIVDIGLARPASDETGETTTRTNAIEIEGAPYFFDDDTLVVTVGVEDAARLREALAEQIPIQIFPATWPQNKLWIPVRRGMVYGAQLWLGDRIDAVVPPTSQVVENALIIGFGPIAPCYTGTLPTDCRDESELIEVQIAVEQVNQVAVLEAAKLEMSFLDVRPARVVP